MFFIVEVPKNYPVHAYHMNNNIGLKNKRREKKVKWVIYLMKFMDSCDQRGTKWIHVTSHGSREQRGIISSSKFQQQISQHQIFNTLNKIIHQEVQKINDFSLLRISES